MRRGAMAERTMNDAVQSAMRRTFCVRCVSCEREKSGVAR